MALFGKNSSSEDTDSIPGTKLLENAARLLGGSKRSYDETIADGKASDREVVVSFIRDYLKELTHRD